MNDESLGMTLQSRRPLMLLTLPISYVGAPFKGQDPGPTLRASGNLTHVD